MGTEGKANPLSLNILVLWGRATACGPAALSAEPYAFVLPTAWLLCSQAAWILCSQAYAYTPGLALVFSSLSTLAWFLCSQADDFGRWPPIEH